MLCRTCGLTMKEFCAFGFSYAVFAPVTGFGLPLRPNALLFVSRRRTTLQTQSYWLRSSEIIAIRARIAKESTIFAVLTDQVLPRFVFALRLGFYRKSLTANH